MAGGGFAYPSLDRQHDCVMMSRTLLSPCKIVDEIPTGVSEPGYAKQLSSENIKSYDRSWQAISIKNSVPEL